MTSVGAAVSSGTFVSAVARLSATLLRTSFGFFSGTTAFAAFFAISAGPRGNRFVQGLLPVQNWGIKYLTQAFNFAWAGPPRVVVRGLYRGLVHVAIFVKNVVSRK